MTSAQVRLTNPPPNQEVQYEKHNLDTSGEDCWIWSTWSHSSGWRHQSVAGCFEHDRELAGFLKGMEEFLVYRPLPRPRKKPSWWMGEGVLGFSLSAKCQSKPAQSGGRHQLLSSGDPYRVSCEQTVWNTKGILGSTLKGNGSGTSL